MTGAVEGDRSETGNGHLLYQPERFASTAGLVEVDCAPEPESDGGRRQSQHDLGREVETLW
jgi:hypothetical protein